jgi:beta-lactamase regulating signal transducer with metallopeptidase domain
MVAWRAMLAASCAMPFLMLIPTLVLSVPTFAVPSVVGHVPALPIVTLSVQPSLAAAPATINIHALLGLVYAVIALAMTLRLLLGLFATWRMCRSAQIVPDPWAGGRDVRATNRLRAPVTFYGTILLPDSFADWPAQKRLAVLAHEARHVERGDFVVLLLSSLHRAIFWFSPAAWVLHGQLVAAAEDGSDEAALSILGNRCAYARLLLDIAREAHAVPMALAMARRNTISRRVARILAGTWPAATLSRRQAIMIACAIMLPAFLVARAVASSPTDQSGGVAVAVEDNSEQAVAERRYAQARPRHQVRIDPALLDNYVGQYELVPGAIFTITRDGGRLFAQLTGQPAAEVFADSDHEFFYRIVPAQLTFLPGGHVPAVALVLHQNGYDQYAKRVDAAEVQNVSDTLAQQAKRTAPASGSEAALRKMIADEQRGQPDYASMGPQLAQAVRSQLPVLQTALASLGTLQSLDFTGVKPSGADTFKAHFANGDADASIKLAPDGRVVGMRIWAAP